MKDLEIIQHLPKFAILRLTNPSAVFYFYN